MPTHSSVAVLTVTYGSRWRFLSQVADAVLINPFVSHFIIVDNGSSQKNDLDKLAVKDKRVRLIRLEKNFGSAVGFAAGLEEVSTTDATYVLLLDDDIVPEKGFVELYIKNYDLIGNTKAVLCGNRVDIPGNEEYFIRGLDAVPKIRGTFFDVFSWKKIERFFQIANRGVINSHMKKKHAFVPCEGFAYGGAFLPMEAIKKAPLPDRDLVLYYDDIEYSWGVLKAGFPSYLCTSPALHDIDMSFGSGSQTVGMCDPNSAPFKAYYFLRNRVRVSIRNTDQRQVILLLNIIIWMSGLLLLGFIRYGLSKKLLRRMKLLFQAVYGGYVTSAKVPKEVILP